MRSRMLLIFLPVLPFLPRRDCRIGRGGRRADSVAAVGSSAVSRMAICDGRDTVGASPATANPAVAVRGKKGKTGKRLITLRERIEFAPHPWPDRPAYRHRLSGSPCMATNFAANEPKILMPSLRTLPEDQPTRISPRDAAVRAARRRRTISRARCRRGNRAGRRRGAAIPARPARRNPRSFRGSRHRRG